MEDQKLQIISLKGEVIDCCQLLDGIKRCQKENLLLVLKKGIYVVEDKPFTVVDDKLALAFTPEVIEKGSTIIDNIALAFFDGHNIKVLPRSFYLKNSELTLKVNDKMSMQLDFTPLTTTDQQCSFTIENNQIATIENGVLTAHFPGKTKLFISSNNMEITYQIKVVSSKQKNNSIVSLILMIVVFIISLLIGKFV